MVEHQGCAGLVNASAFCAIEQEVKGESTVNVIAEISAELQKERQKNAQLMERISLLEAQIQERDKESLLPDGQVCLILPTSYLKRYIRKFKRQKIETSCDRTEEANVIKSDMASKTKHERCILQVDANLEGRLVNWMMSMDETQFLHFDKVKDGEPAADCDDSDESEDEDDECYEDDETNARTDNCEPKEQLHEEDFDQGMLPCLENFVAGQSEATVANVSQGTIEYEIEDCKPLDSQTLRNQGDLKKHDKREVMNNGEYKAQEEMLMHKKEACHTGSASILVNKKPAKVPFCPKEVKRILESEALLLKTAQSHTIRKIIVFASLGIRHGCEDMYELDFNHFSILRKGEPFVSPKNPGEHVLYENPGVRRKVFYPNRQNPTFCPVQILEEEKAMRPSDPSCPSCLFLCIKYGGRTRNLPQNEYVRQRMGRNKLKSFGPVMCRMAMLVHVRSGSFFFKALGITLLFMAGFPDDLVQRETKYRNLDLLQKYYRTDRDAEGEELFLPYPATPDSPSSGSQQLTGKTTTTKSKVRKQSNSASKAQNAPRSSMQQSAPPSAVPPAQFGMMGYASIQNHGIAPFQSMPSQTHADTPLVSNQVFPNSATNVSYRNQSPYHIFPPQPANTFMPMMYWPPPSAFPPSPYPTTYGYRSFPSTANYISIHPQPYNNHPSSSPFVPKMVEGSAKNNAALEEPDSDSDNSSSSTEPKEPLASCN
ncbi:hypothetical protein Patl1_10026 [Pistacia atlantica]|uniref:Uncharacterized protein n=1 Tax=Pistacia atlantica TaxID=434234 RepID=A0ACC1A6C0_9ROSI|nr:hypothetical protein Patl1_10026 [Pistacia atlantica]